MSGPLTPEGYDVAKPVSAERSDCRITVGFDQDRSHIPRFLVQLHYLASSSPPEWETIARFDHNEKSRSGHDVYQEGLHVDIFRRSGLPKKLYPRQGPLPQNRGLVIRNCAEYFDAEAEYFVDVFEGNIAPGGPPPWPDGGE